MREVAFFRGMFFFKFPDYGKCEFEGRDAQDFVDEDVNPADDVIDSCVCREVDGDVPHLKTDPAVFETASFVRQVEISSLNFPYTHIIPIF